MPRDLDHADLDEWSRRLAEIFGEASRTFANEMELREHVHPVIVAAILDIYGMAFTTSTGERSPGRGSRLRYDRIYGGLAVEWEWDMGTARREHGADQALGYLGQPRAAGRTDAFSAVVADGKQWGFLAYDLSKEEDDLFSTAPETQAGHFIWRQNSPAACRQFLELIGSHQQQPLTATSLRRTFGPDSEQAHRAVAVLSQALAGRDEGDRADTLLVEWRRALDVVYGDLDRTDSRLAEVVAAAYDVEVTRPIGELLFVLHTYFALVARFIAVELLAISVNDDEMRPTYWRGLSDADLVRRLGGLDRGDLPGGLDISNLFEADVFSWWLEIAEGNANLLTVLRELLDSLNSLAFPRIVFGPAPATDVLRDLYQSLVPRQLRQALGEFLTPTWLAQACLERLAAAGADMASGRVLDPTCGTGTFLQPVLANRMRRLATQGDPTVADVQAVLDSVCGIDLNPVAVIAARVNFVIALGDLASVGPLTLPVWRADSILLPAAPPAQDALGELTGLSYRQLRTSLAEPFPVPATLADSKRLPAVRALLEELLEERPGEEAYLLHARLIANRDVFLNDLDSRYAVDEGDTWENERQVAAILYDRLAALVVEGRDGVWARIIENAFAPTFAGMFDVVVGNPPWLTWTKLPTAWRNESKRVWRRYGLWKVPDQAGSSFSLASTDIAVLVFAVAIERYLSREGVLGLLTPDSLLIADPGGRAFRQFRLRTEEDFEVMEDRNVDLPFGIVHVDDWSDVRPFAPEASNKPVFIIARPGLAQQSSTPASRWARAESRAVLKATWRETRPFVVERVGNYVPVDPATPSSAWSYREAGAPPLISGGSNSWSFGKGLDTRGANGIYFVRLISSDRTQGRVVIENLPAEGRNRAVEVVRGAVNASLVYPLLRGRDVQRWRAIPVTYFVLPHDLEALGEVLPASTLRSNHRQTWQWLRRHRDVLSARRVPPTRSWRMEGDDWCRVDGPLQHMAGEHLVVVREQSQRPAAAVVEAVMDFDLGRVTTPLIDHKLLFCSVATRDEALYLAAFINSSPVQDLLASFINEIAVSPTTLRRLPIPSWNAENQTMLALAEAARPISGADGVDALLVEAQPVMDRLVLHLLDEDPSVVESQPARRGAPRPRPTMPVDDRDLLF